MPQTPKHQIPYPLGSDPPLAPAQMQALSTRVDDCLPFASSSAPAHIPGLVWLNPDTGLAQMSDGTTWRPLASPSAPRGVLWNGPLGAAVNAGNAWATVVTANVAVETGRAYRVDATINGNQSGAAGNIQFRLMAGAAIVGANVSGAHPSLAAGANLVRNVYGVWIANTTGTVTFVAQALSTAGTFASAGGGWGSFTVTDVGIPPS